MYAILIVGFLAAAVAAVPTTTACNKDNCLRAVTASAFPTRQGQLDCSSYFLTTVTPATYTSTITVTSSPIMTIQGAITDTIATTDTLTTVETISSATTTTTTTTSAVPAKAKRNDNPNVRREEDVIVTRQTTKVPSSIPSYASACSGSVRYSSACSCIGVTRSTVTAATPRTTISVTTTTSLTVLTTETSLATQTVDITTTIDTTTVASIVVSIETVMPTAPAGCDSTYTTPGGDEYSTYCNEFVDGSETFSETQSSFFDCINRCSTLSNCVAVSYYTDGSPHNCLYFDFSFGLMYSASLYSAERMEAP